MRNLNKWSMFILCSAFMVITLLIAYKYFEPSQINVEAEMLLGFSNLKIKGDDIKSDMTKNSNTKLYDEYNNVAKMANGIIDATVAAIKNNSSNEESKFIDNSINNDLNPKIKALSEKIKETHGMINFMDNIINLGVPELLDFLSKDKNLDTKNYYIEKLDSYRWLLII